MKSVILISATALLLSGCQMSNVQQKAAIGAGIGAVAGQMIDGDSKGTATGALLGAIAGGIAGSVQDRTEARLRDAYEQGIAEGSVQVQRDQQDQVQVTFSDAVLFDFGSAAIKSSYYPALGSLANIMVAEPTLRAKIIGHTDAIGSADSNQTLSVQRATNVKSFVIQRPEIQASRVTVLGMGEKAPIASNESEYGRAQNRRIEVVFEE